MRANSTLRFIAAILLALCSCCALACGDSDCLEDSHACSLLADDAVVSRVHNGDLNRTLVCADAVTDQTAYLTRFAATDVFRPPNASA